MKFSTSLLSVAVLATGTVSAQSSSAMAISTLTITPKACPTGAPADVMMTRSAVAVPSCEAGGNSTTPVVVVMNGTATMTIGGSKTPTASGGAAATFTGAAAANGAKGVAAIFGGAIAALLL
ncbi:hypothetical protein EJ02DRAFT_458257 [Clathrospora elynae]|uniref:Uncharacterized protein n=1 Tax=Clathrospora elynae TaxID=706981 RepID=A0A6A5SBK8_9PLEO|nr:hypothetical protein EJ02DRAFT_458257 [Clathrospora elynae]